MAETFLFTSESVGEGHPGNYWQNNIKYDSNWSDKLSLLQ